MRSFGFGVFMLVMGIVVLGLGLIREFDSVSDLLFQLAVATAFIVVALRTFHDLTKQR
jgi:tellurite resistance protein TehA-like permease